MVTTTANEKVDSSKELIKEAHQKIGEVLLGRGTLWGADEYHREWLKTMLARIFSASKANGHFPVKTSMSVCVNDITVNCGYHAPTERLMGLHMWWVEGFSATSNEFITFYFGTSEDEARYLFNLAKSINPGVNIDHNFDHKKNHIFLRKDGNLVN